MDKLKIGGMALVNGVILQSENYSVRTEYLDKIDDLCDYKGKIKITEKKIAKTSKIVEIFFFIPFLRGIIYPLVAAIQKYLDKEISLINFLINIKLYILFIVSALFSTHVGFSWYNLLPIIVMSFFTLLIWFASKIPGIKRLFMFHGAEHIVVRSYEEDLSFNTEIETSSSSLWFEPCSYYISFNINSTSYYDVFFTSWNNNSDSPILNN